MKKILLIFLVFIFILLVSCELGGAGESFGSIEGQVEVELSDTFFNTIMVYIDGESVFFRMEGDVMTIPMVPPGSHIVSIYAYQKIPFIADITVVGTESADLGPIRLESSHVIYVATEADGGSDDNSGLTGDEPLASPVKAHRLAKDIGAGQVKIAEGSYDFGGEFLDVNFSLGISGGYDVSDWETSDPDNHETVFTGSDNVIWFFGTPFAWISNLTIRPAVNNDDDGDDDYSRGINIAASNVWVINVNVEPLEESYRNFEAVKISAGAFAVINNSAFLTGSAEEHINGIRVMEGGYLQSNNCSITTGNAGTLDSYDDVVAGTDDSSIYGLYLDSDSRADISAYSINLGDSYEGNFGVHSTESSSVKIVDSNIISGGSSISTSAGIIASHGSEVQISSSDITAGAGFDNSQGIVMLNESYLIIDNSYVHGGYTEHSYNSSVGIAIYEQSSAFITDNVLIEPGVAPNSMQIGISLGTSGSVEILDNIEITGGGSGLRNVGIDIYENSGEVLISGNQNISGGDAELSACDLAANNFTFLDINENNFTGGSAYEVKNIDAGSYWSDVTFQITNNTLTGGASVRGGGLENVDDFYYDSTNIRVFGFILAIISGNDISSGTLDNKVADGWSGGVTVLNPGAYEVIFGSNVIHPVDPSSTEVVYLRGVHGGMDISTIHITNNLFSLYQSNGSLHILEAENYADYVVGNNTFICENADPVESEILISSHWFAQYEIMNNIFYFPVDSGETFEVSQNVSADLDSNIFINFEGILDASLNATRSWAILYTDTATYLTDTFQSADTDLSDGNSGDWHLRDLSQPINYGEGLFSLVDYPILLYDIDGNTRSWAPWETIADNAVDAGAYEYTE
ncbi:MAG: hypothetical protein JEY99_10560 [Spirochaetales bacterium]|nr:hypothetical protein [Spirochaetales bacterium]